MNSQLVFLFYLFLTQNHLILLTVAKSCQLDGTTCKFNEVKTNKNNPKFNPTSRKSDDNNVVEKVTFTNSKMIVLTDELCRAFPNLKVLDVSSLSIESIMPHALDECKNLIDFIIFNNSLTEINENVFVQNDELDFVSFQMNHLTNINPQTFFHTRKLQHLELGANNLQEFSFDDFPDDLRSLWLYVNELSDLNATEMIRKFPELREIALHDNYFDPVRYAKMKNVFLQNGVKIVSFKTNFWTNVVKPTMSNQKVMNESSKGYDPVYIIIITILSIVLLISISFNSIFIFKRKQVSVKEEPKVLYANNNLDVEENNRDSHLYDTLDFDISPKVKSKHEWFGKVMKK